MNPSIELASFIRDVPDFPKPGIVFKDISPLLASPAAMALAVEGLIEPYLDAGVELVAGVESRGFLFGAVAAVRLGAGFVPIRKPGKLPWKTASAEYELEYGSDSVEIHTDAIAPGQKVLMIDDLLATGGTMSAACELVRMLEGDIVGASFVVELSFLGGREKKLQGVPVHSLLKVEAE